MKNVLVVYYTQSGQLKQIADKITNVLKEQDVNVDFHEIRPITPYTFPWNNDSFFDAFPESVQGIPCKLEEASIDSKKYDLVILAFQVWFLSPSIPFWSFLESETAKELLAGKNVITLLGVRNMWIMAQERVKRKIHELGANHVGNIVMQDRHQNLVSVITIVHWMYTARKERFGIFPPAGVSDDDIEKSSRFGYIIGEALGNDDFSGMQAKLIESKAVKILPDIMSIEEKAIRIFGVWSKFVLKKGGTGDPARKGRLKLFRYYLFTIIYLVSPIASLVFYITSPFFLWRIIPRIKYYKSCKL